jgi:hypothetical protein
MNLQLSRTRFRSAVGSEADNMNGEAVGERKEGKMNSQHGLGFLFGLLEFAYGEVGGCEVWWASF